MTPRAACQSIANLNAAASYFRWAFQHAENDQQMVESLSDWLATEKAAQLLADEALEERI